ncbi:MAG: helix-turn-helix transcriptional regulator [Candidatus Gastranaerophilaceae bacterium]
MKKENEKPRYSRVSDIIDLATFMASRVEGITIRDIMTRYNVSRRTAERMRDSLLNIFPQIMEIETKDTQKHWGFSDYSIKELVSFTSKEIASIEQFKKRTSNNEMKKELESVVEKIKTLSQKSLSKIENNIGLILQTEGYAVRQTQQYKIDDNILILMREALKNCKMVKCTYHNKKRLIEPLGMVYGEKIYLIAREKAKGNDIYTYLLNKFENIELTEQIFDRDNFNLDEYSKQSFGVYHGEILNVKLQFSSDIAQEVLNYNFHPTQKVKQIDDGSVIVKFKASGDKEIMWHIFKWGDKVKILAPDKLKKEYQNTLKQILEINK